ncbi:unnamed protein product [Owenia fusiformis]|uniref:Uncharacterized protein n=1 Tax=Owenia fusiformis TaxID=6347 RepID=A0A8J1T8B6_OWEFU|nr:unnamed protein product [Owenia fusiformis]
MFKMSIEVGPNKRGLPKLRDLLRRQRGESESMPDSPDLEFVYDDADTYLAEISELYSYTEETEFPQNRNAFETLFPNTRWLSIGDEERKVILLNLLDRIEVSGHKERIQALQALLYLVQGVFGECETEDQQVDMTAHNCYLVYEVGVFAVCVSLLNMESENVNAASAALRKPAVSLADSSDLRLILNVLYTVVETLRHKHENDSEEEEKTRQLFITELGSAMYEEETLAVILCGMITKFCNGSAPHFPMKKILLLIWKVLLVSLGTLQDCYERKNNAREAAGLPRYPENTLEVCKSMRAASPPASAADLIEQQQLPRARTRSYARKNSMEDPTGIDPNGDTLDGEDEITKELAGSDDEIPPTPPRPSTPAPARGLPWTPKVRKKDLEAFLDHTRVKFVGFHVPDDLNSLAGLPQPIHEGVKVLKQHLYISLAELMVKREEEIAANPLSKPEGEVKETATEILYRGLLPNLPQYVIALLKILLAAAPTSKAKTDSINILADVLPEEMPTTVLQSMKLGIDVNRHKEIIVKSISGLLLLLLKHLKINHIYQFEFLSQHLVFANCIPLVLKFFNQNISSYISAKNVISALDFPNCVIGPQPELTAENLEAGDNQQFCWRNLFSCINLLRILNKLTKWKHSRTMMLVVFKSAPILKRALKVKQAMMQLYVLKLLKMQTKYLGRQWRKSNMKTMSAIYSKVRHRLNDDWAFGNDMDARPWDFQAEESALRTCVDCFNTRRYSINGYETEYKSVDNCLQSVLGQDIELSEEFKQHYERWLEMEVYNSQIDWDQVIMQC